MKNFIEMLYNEQVNFMNKISDKILETENINTSIVDVLNCYLFLRIKLLSFALRLRNDEKFIKEASKLYADLENKLLESLIFNKDLYELKYEFLKVIKFLEGYKDKLTEYAIDDFLIDECAEDIESLKPYVNPAQKNYKIL